jgi:hypothetical protein
MGRSSRYAWIAFDAMLGLIFCALGIAQLFAR